MFLLCDLQPRSQPFTTTSGTIAPVLTLAFYPSAATATSCLPVAWICPAVDVHMFQAQVVVFQPGSSQILIAKSTSHPFDENTVTTRAANGKSHHFRSQSTSRCAAPDLASLYQDAADTTCVLLILSPASSIKYSYLPSKTERPDFQTSS